MLQNLTVTSNDKKIPLEITHQIIPATAVSPGITPHLGVYHRADKYINDDMLEQLVLLDTKNTQETI